MKKPETIQKNSQKGFHTLEALVSIVIFLLGIIGLAGMQAGAIGHNSNATYRAEAAFLADSIVSEMWLDRNNLSSYASGSAPAMSSWRYEVGSRLPGAMSNPPVITVNGNDITVTINWQDFRTNTLMSYQTRATILPP